MTDVSGVGQLGKTDFLNLLATQLRNQNPMNPVDNTQFIAQLAQFSALEAATQTAEEISQLSQQEAKTYATALLGKQVTGVTSGGAAFSGQVTGLDFSGTLPKAKVQGITVELAEIKTIS